MTTTQINSICSDRFGCGFVALDPTAALWLAEHIMQTTGKNVWKTISAARNRMGRGTMLPEYKSLCW